MNPMNAEEKEKLKWTAISTLFFFLLGNGYAYFEFNPIHDALGFALNEQGIWQTMLGRFLLPLYLKCRGEVSSPFIIGSLSVLYLTAGIYMICLILHLRTRLEIILTSAFLSTNLFTFEISAVHQYYADAFLVAFLFSCAGVYLLDSAITKKRIAASVLCFFISFGVYPAFITFAACLFIIIFCRRMINGDTDTLIRDVFIWLGTSITAGLLYAAGSRAALIFRHLRPSDARQSIFSFGSLSAEKILKSVMNNYNKFFAELFNAGDYTGRSAGYAATVLAVLCLLCFISFAVKKIRSVRLFILVGALLLFPVISRLVNVFTGNRSFRTIYAQYLLFPVLIRLCFLSLENIRNRSGTILKCAIVLLSGVIVGKSIQFNNGGFVLRKVMYERTLYHTGRVIADIDEFTDGHGTERKIAVIHIFDLDTHSSLTMEKQKKNRYRNVEGFGGDTGISYVQVFKNTADVLGYDLKWESKYTDAVKDLPEVKKMPAYPEPGYIAEIGEYLVIKLSD